MVCRSNRCVTWQSHINHVHHSWEEFFIYASSNLTCVCWIRFIQVLFLIHLHPSCSQCPRPRPRIKSFEAICCWLLNALFICTQSSQINSIQAASLMLRRPFYHCSHHYHHHWLHRRLPWYRLWFQCVPSKGSSHVTLSKKDDGWWNMWNVKHWMHPDPGHSLFPSFLELPWK